MIKIDKNNIKDISRLTGLAFVIFAVIQRVLGEGISALLHRVYPVPDFVIITGEIIIYCASMLAAIAILTEDSGSWNINKPKREELIPAIVAFIGFFYPIMLVNSFMSRILSAVHIESYSAAIDVPKDLSSLMLMIVQLVILPPICEELLFRGALLSRLRRFGDGFAIICSSVIFMMLHPTLYSLPGVFLLGALFAYADIRCNSILPSVIMHMINNGVTLLVNAIESQIWTVYAGTVIFGLSMFCMAYILIVKPWRKYGYRRMNVNGPYISFFTTVPVLSFIAFGIWNLWRLTTFT